MGVLSTGRHSSGSWLCGIAPTPASLLLLAVGICCTVTLLQLGRQRDTSPLGYYSPGLAADLGCIASSKAGERCLNAILAKAKARGSSISGKVAWEELKAASSRRTAQPRRQAVESTGRMDESKDGTLDSMMRCLTHPTTAGQVEALSWQSATRPEAELTAFRVLAAWWVHSKPSHNESTVRPPVTVVTSGSMDRLSQLRAMCRSWRGPLSAALIQQVIQEEPLPLNATNMGILQKAILDVASLVAEMALHPTACELSVLLGYEVYAEETATLLYPINNLRNYARLQARTPLVALLDIDMLPSQTFLNRLTTSRGADKLVEQARTDKNVYILPAFELRGRFDTGLWADALVSINKRDLMRIALESGMLRPFYHTRYNTGHNLTDFPQWLETNFDYTVPHQPGCEPYIMGDRLSLPWFDSRYRGFGRNKVQHLESVHYEGFHFKVLNDVFLIHRPHRWTKAQMVYSQKLPADGAGQTSLSSYLATLFAKQEGAMLSQQVWDAPLSPAMQHCLDVLPWWQGAIRRDLNASAAAADIGPFHTYIPKASPKPVKVAATIPDFALTVAAVSSTSATAASVTAQQGGTASSQEATGTGSTAASAVGGHSGTQTMATGSVFSLNRDQAGVARVDEAQPDGAKDRIASATAAAADQKGGSITDAASLPLETQPFQETKFPLEWMQLPSTGDDAGDATVDTHASHSTQPGAMAADQHTDGTTAGAADKATGLPVGNAVPGVSVDSGKLSSTSASDQVYSSSKPTYGEGAASYRFPVHWEGRRSARARSRSQRQRKSRQVTR